MITLLHVDAALAVADKPSGLLAVPGRGAEHGDCVASRVVAQLPDALVVHRLDQPTSGLMLMARGEAMQRRLSRAFAERAIDKRYIAVVAGLVADDRGQIDLPIAADWPNRPRRIVDAARGQAALTRWQVLARDPATQTTRLELEPHTGRTHQLRVHLAAIGHPILGDALYAPPGIASAAPRLLLHAARLGFAHPASGVAFTIESPVPF